MAIEKQSFLDKYNLSTEVLDRCPIVWEDLASIHDVYVSIREDMVASAKSVVERLGRCPQAHSLKYRLKSPEGLVEKIVRKCTDDAERQINIENYRAQVTDLIGVRVLYLFRQDWVRIHTFIKEHWEVHEPPTAYIREGDDQELRESYSQQGCQVRIHPRHYRSVHYVIRQNVTLQDYHLVEIQVRTLFEEGWSEVDHRMRYSQGKATDASDPLLVQLLTAHNRMAGTADEVASYIQRLKLELEERDAKLLAIEANFKEHFSKNNMHEETQLLLKEFVRAVRGAPPSSNEETVGLGSLIMSSMEQLGSLISVANLRMCKSNLRDLGSAIERFMDKNGKCPTRLSELVPDYLPEIPVCPDAKKTSYSLDPGEGGDFQVFCPGRSHRSAGLIGEDLPSLRRSEGFSSIADEDRSLLSQNPVAEKGDT